MAPAGGLIAAAAGLATTSAVAAGAFGSFFLPILNAGIGSVGLFSSLAGAVVSSAVNLVGGRAFTKKPKAPQFTLDAGGRTLTVRSSVESQKILYGTVKTSGPLALITATDSGTDNNGVTRSGPNRFIHMVIPLAGHEVEEISGIYFNDQLLTLDGNGWATSRPYGRTETTSTSTDTVKTVSSITRTNGNIVTVTTSSAHTFSVGEQIILSGIDETEANLNAAFYIGSVPTDTTFTITKNGINGSVPLTANPKATRRTTVTSNVTTSYARVKKFLGTDSQTASPDLVAEVPQWTEDHRGRGIAYIYVRLEFSNDIFPTGIPNVSAIVKGKKVFDPRTSTTYWMDNAALCIRDYLTSVDGAGFPYGFGCEADEINDDYFIAAANICDENVTITGGATQNRYTCNGLVDTAIAPLDNMQGLITSMAGAVTYVQGSFRAHAAAYEAPAGALTDDLLAGSIKTDVRASRKEICNAVKGTFVDPEKGWQPTDFPSITNPTYEAQDNGERIYRDIELPFTNHPEAAQRIAKIILEKSRQGLKVTMPVSHAAFKYSVWDVVTVTSQTKGWTNKPFRIVRWNMEMPGPITVTLQEESSASYDWNSGEATTIDTAPDTDLPSPFDVQEPGALTVSESKYVTRFGNGVKVMAMLSWVPSTDPFLREYQAEYKTNASSSYSLIGKTDSNTIVVEDIEPGIYDFRVKAINRLLVSSDYSTATRQITGLLDPPTEPQNLTVSTIGGLAILRCDPSQDLDVSHGGSIVFRHSPDTAAGWTQSTSIGERFSGRDSTFVLPLKPGVYLAKFVDSSGIESVNAASVETTQATALNFANVTSLTEHPTFTGSKTGCYVNELGLLRISGSGVFSAIPLVSTEPSISGYGGISSSATYAFSGGIDLGAVTRIRLTSHILATVFNQLDTIGSRTALMSTWLSFTGAGAASADASIYVRSTNDNPSGSPTWSSWNRLDSSEFNARAFQFELDMTSNDPAYNISVQELSISADEVV